MCIFLTIDHLNWFLVPIFTPIIDSSFLFVVYLEGQSLTIIFGNKFTSHASNLMHSQIYRI